MERCLERFDFSIFFHVWNIHCQLNHFYSSTHRIFLSMKSGASSSEQKSATELTGNVDICWLLKTDLFLLFRSGYERRNTRRYEQTSSSRPYPYNYNLMSNVSSSRTDVANDRFSRSTTPRNGGSNSNYGNNDMRSNQRDPAVWFYVSNSAKS